MFREIRRNKQVLSKEENITILKEGITGILAVSGDDNYPYTVPLNYVYYHNKLYFHWAKSGHKLDAITRNNKVSFCVIHEDNIVPEKYTTYFKSVIVFGKAHIIEDEKKMKEMIEILALKYHPSDTKENRETEINKYFQSFYMIEVDIEHISGKQAKELVL